MSAAQVWTCTRKRWWGAYGCPNAVRCATRCGALRPPPQGCWSSRIGCGRRVVPHVGMEATGGYWKPGWDILEGEFELILANPAHIRNVPGRKSDVNDATWIADLLAHGLIRASMVPPGPIQELRDLTRTRKQLMREVVQHKQRIQKVL